MRDRRVVPRSPRKGSSRETGDRGYLTCALRPTCTHAWHVVAIARVRVGEASRPRADTHACVSASRPTGSRFRGAWKRRKTSATRTRSEERVKSSRSGREGRRTTEAKGRKGGKTTGSAWGNRASRGRETCAAVRSLLPPSDVTSAQWRAASVASEPADWSRGMMAGAFANRLPSAALGPGPLREYALPTKVGAPRRGGVGKEAVEGDRGTAAFGQEASPYPKAYGTNGQTVSYYGGE